MKKAILLTLLLTVMAAGIVLYWFVPLNSPPRPVQSYQLPQSADDTLHVAFIGDSWAFEHKPDDRRLALMLEEALQRPVGLYSYGICGHTSKDIYRALFISKPLRQLMTARSYQYCIVSAGINDSYRKMSTGYYRQSMAGIVRFLLHNHVCPVVIEIPNYDVHRAYDIQAPSRKVLRQLSMLVNQTPFDCRQLFRDTFRQLVSERNWTDSLIIVSCQSWNADFADGQERLYRHDGMHLNAAGRARLDSAIVRAVAIRHRQTLCLKTRGT